MPRCLFPKLILNSISLKVEINKHTHKTETAKGQAFKHVIPWRAFHIQAVSDTLQIAMT